MPTSVADENETVETSETIETIYFHAAIQQVRPTRRRPLGQEKGKVLNFSLFYSVGGEWRRRGVVCRVCDQRAPA